MTKRLITKYSMILSLLMLSTSVFAQKTKVVTIINADKSTYNRSEDENLRKFIGNVIFEIDSTYLYCDTAYLNDETKDIDAYSNVHIKVSDTMNMYSDILHYLGETRIAKMFGDVKLIDNTTILTTDKLFYDRNTAIAEYNTGGEIVDSVNRLTSIKGYYHTEIKEFTFHDSVRVFNPDYTMTSDTLMYNTLTKTSYFYGPSWIESDENTLYAKHGWYNTISNITELQDDAYLFNDKQTMRGDSLYYDRDKGYGIARRNIWMHDTVQNVVLTGHHAEYFELRNFAYATDSARAIFIDGFDSLFVSADTLRAVFDTTQQLENVYAYFGTRFFHDDMQGACDSLKYSSIDSVITMYNNPVLWAEDSQIVADTIVLNLNGTEIENMELFYKAMITSHDTLDWYNQIKGKYMIADFVENHLNKIDAEGNAETLYYIKDDYDELIGLNKSVSSSMTIYFENNKIFWITYRDDPKLEMNPMKLLTDEDRFFPDFNWQEDRKPTDKDDVYRRSEK